jgi:hypothetical protein
MDDNYMQGQWIVKWSDLTSSMDFSGIDSTTKRAAWLRLSNYKI